MHAPLQSVPSAHIRLELESRPEDVPLARDLLRGLADTLPLPPTLLDDLRTAVTEACNNVVQHAYDGKVGELLLDFALEQDAIEVTVRDRGRGMRPWIRTPAANNLGIGLMVIKALTERMEVRDAPEGGIEIVMRFATSGLSPPDQGGPIPQVPRPPENAVSPPGQGGPISRPPQSPEDAVSSADKGDLITPAPQPLADAVSSAAISAAPAGLVNGVLPRILSAMAARAHFTTDRIADLQVLGDTVAAHADAVELNGHLCIRIGTLTRDIRLSLSPLRIGGADTLLRQTAIDGVGHLLAAIVDEHQVLQQDASETLRLRVLDRR